MLLMLALVIFANVNQPLQSPLRPEGALTDKRQQKTLYHSNGNVPPLENERKTSCEYPPPCFFVCGCGWVGLTRQVRYSVRHELFGLFRIELIQIVTKCQIV